MTQAEVGFVSYVMMWVTFILVGVLIFKGLFKDKTNNTKREEW